MSSVSNYIKPKLWKEKPLTGNWDFTLKIDGVRMLRDIGGHPVSRSGKPLYNLGHISKAIVDAEVYAGDWESSISLVRTSVNGSPVPEDTVYSLHPLDPRLILGTYENPTVEFIQKVMDAYVLQGYEGLILRQGTKELKVKPKDTADVMVTGLKPGTGKYEGMLGAFLTDHGNVGTGLTDADRVLYNDPSYIGQVLEVEFMEVTKDSKMRHPRFIRIREDKVDESLPWVTEDE